MLAAEQRTDFEARFSGVGRLVGVPGLERLRRAHVCVVGLGGVGSWAVEALARSGVGQLTLVDLDEVCVSNINRQLPALTSEVGRTKAGVLAERVHGIHPDCIVHQRIEFFTAATAEAILSTPFDFLLDAIDNVSNKCLLISECVRRGIPLVTTGGAGGRRDPTAIKVADLAFSSHDRLLQKVRRKLRSDHGFPTQPEKPFGVDCVYSPEAPVFPHSDGTVCAAQEAGTDLHLNCESGYGTAAFVTGTFGFTAAGRIVRRLAEQSPK